MKKVIIAAITCTCLGGPALAMTDAECSAIWKQADANADGTLSGAETDRYMAMMRMANKSPTADGTLTEKLFQENCKTDVFTTAVVDAGAPLEGANSFTEDQAKDRIVAFGLNAPASMTKDEKGIWRGTAMKDGASVSVAVDYKGNVVAQ